MKKIDRYDIEKILNQNIKEIPYEGTEVNKNGIIEDILELIKNNLPAETTNEQPYIERPENRGYIG